jgi:hypothetical protein
MNITNARNIFGLIAGFGKEHSTTILTTLAVGGVVTTAVMAADAGIESALMIRNELDRDTAVEGYPAPMDLTLKEKALLTWKNYIPAAGMGLATIACIVAAHSIGEKRYSALAALYGLAETTITKYREKIIEKVGEKKEQELRGEIMQDKLDATPINNTQIIFTGGDTLCYDGLSGRYFKGDIETVRRKMNDFNEDLLRCQYKTANEWYCALGLPVTGLGDLVGWSVKNGTVDEFMLNIDFGAKLAADNTPCITLEYMQRPMPLPSGTKLSFL